MRFFQLDYVPRMITRQSSYGLYFALILFQEKYFVYIYICPALCSAAIQQKQLVVNKLASSICSDIALRKYYSVSEIK